MYTLWIWNFRKQMKSWFLSFIALLNSYFTTKLYMGNNLFWMDYSTRHIMSPFIFVNSSVRPSAWPFFLARGSRSFNLFPKCLPRLVTNTAGSLFSSSWVRFLSSLLYFLSASLLLNGQNTLYAAINFQYVIVFLQNITRKNAWRTPNPGARRHLFTSVLVKITLCQKYGEACMCGLSF